MSAVARNHVYKAIVKKGDKPIPVVSNKKIASSKAAVSKYPLVKK